MNTFQCAAGFSIHRSGKQNLVSLLLLALCFTISPQSLLASQDRNVPPQQQDAQQTPGQLQQLVAPIALYPDSLVSQILAASTYPEQVVEADRWVQAHPALQGEALGETVNQQPWDPSIKALTAFPSVLGSMDKNLSWTSSLGDAYYNQQSDVMAAVQAMRQKAQSAGSLQSEAQETITTQDSNISIEPADPDEVYVPAYDPWVVYGDPVAAWPGWHPYPGIWFGGPNLYCGAHFGIGWHRGYGWGWNHWGVDWRGRSVLYDHNRFQSRSTTFDNRNAFDRDGVERFDRRESDNHPVERLRPFNRDTRAARGYAEPRGESGIRSNAFSGYNHGAEERGFSSRGKRKLRWRRRVPRRWRAAITALPYASDLKGFRMENRLMWRKQLNIYTSLCTRLLLLAALAILLAGCFPGCSIAQQTGQKTFSSPEDASDALLTALQSNNEKELLDVFGPDNKQIVRSGDDTEDAQSRTNFVEKYKEMHRLAKEPDGTTTLIIGARNWPIPIPLVNKNDSWYFDTEAGANEILFRRIGRNEISAIRVCQELVAAQKEYRSSQHDEYARKILSDECQHNGLYWKVAKGEPQSPIGPLATSAVGEGYAKGQAGPPTAYRGYYFHILTKQGKNASGGAKSYIVDGKMTEVFAFLAYPADYRSSGVMTFIVNQDGVVLQKDLGKKTDVLAKAMKKYNSDSSWRKADAQQEETAGEPQNKWQVGTITAVQCHQVADADPSITSCEVSLRVGDTVYVVLYKPPFGIDTVFTKGRNLEVLIGIQNLKYNDLLGHSFQVPILSRTIVTAQAGQ